MYNLDTQDGMAKAIDWTNFHMDRIKTGGVWMVPRSGTLVTLVSRDPKQVRIVGLLPDKSIPRVLEAAGWEVLP